MSDPMRIRANTVPGTDFAEIKILMRHDMETGLRKDAAGVLIPAHHIKTIIAKCKDKLVMEAHFGPSVSKDPFLSFKFKGGAKGDKVNVTWTDNKGDSRTDEVAIV
jgi:sulfur-oxidizing protein SoxZ